MHWVLIYFLIQPIGGNHPQAGAGGVGQIRFKTKAACERFYDRLKQETERVEVSHAKFGRFSGKEKVHNFQVDGMCMVWNPT